MGILYVVATPIGNLQDITIRAMKVLLEVDTIACEDTRRTGVLLENLTHIYNAVLYNEDRIQSKPKLLSYYDEIELRRIPEILSLLHNGQHIALISDAGMPTVSDPGYKLIREVIREGCRVEVVPGASSVLTALAVSGLPTDKFLFVGYLPQKPGHRLKFFENIQDSISTVKSTVIFFEAPHKLLRTLQDLHNVFGDIDVVICRELTKVHEEVRREKVLDAISHFEKQHPKGEFVVLFHLEKTK